MNRNTWVTVILLSTVTYNSAADTAAFNDPCNNYTSLDQPWRATNATGLDICDSYFNWNGWYRLLYYGKNIRMPESCVDESRCGTDITLWLSDPHPKIEDGIVTREVCGSTAWACCFYRSTSIQVKACPGKYYVYELVSPPLLCNAAYCADVNTISADIATNVPSSTVTDSSTNRASDPCNGFRILDDEWRGANHDRTTSSGHDDTLGKWKGWYRLYLQGKSAQIPESNWCSRYMSCGGYTSLFLNGSHPRRQDGIVSRYIYGTYASKCKFYKSNPIQVKACPGNYYVYRLVKPALSLPMPTYCAVVFNTPSYDPCNNYTSLDQPWRGTNATGLNICDRDFNWTGWYHLLYNGMSVRMSESCVNGSRCGTNITLWLNGPHPQIEDGIVTRGVCGSSGSGCCYYRPPPIRVKACPGNYYVYEFVRPTVCNLAYCADVNTITLNTTLTLSSGVATSNKSANSPEDFSMDPCNVSNVLDNEWRRTNSYLYTSYKGHDDTLVEWKGWYRLYLQGKSARIPESDWCANYMSCGGYTSLLLRGSHPLPKDGIVTRDIYGIYGRKCNFNQSNPIQVKACPGNYYVYKLVKPAVSLPMPTYCAVVSNTPSYDPCNNYTTLDRPWRGTNVTGLFNCDTYFNWNGWYRLMYNGMNIRMSESCVNVGRCGTVVGLWLNGSHPLMKDGIVTRGVCGKYESDCCWYRAFPIRVKACPGNYYVYELVKPTNCKVAYCSDVNNITQKIISASNAAASSTNTTHTTQNITSDPCSVYNVINDDWRRLDYPTYGSYDDTLVQWSGWYRLYLQGKSAQIPESVWCSNHINCGGYISLLLGGPHPQPQDGIVNRTVYGTYSSVTDNGQCNSYRSKPIQVKACPGNYYVYKLVKPAVSLPMPTYCAVALDTPSYDPCNNYTSLDQRWRGANETGGFNSDNNFIWTGWYRLLYYGMSVPMPDSCVNVSRCGTNITLWLNGSHPQIKDGIVTRGVCGKAGSDCCYYRSTPIRVKACPARYYVYEFVRPSFYLAAYCADQNFTVSAECKKKFTLSCADNLFNKLENNNNLVLSQDIVKQALKVQTLQIQTIHLEQNISSGIQVLNRTETLVSSLVNHRQDNYSVNISVDGLDGQILAVGLNVFLKESLQPTKNSTPMDVQAFTAPQLTMNNTQMDINQISKHDDDLAVQTNASLKAFHQLSINNAQMDINLIQISKNNNGSAAVAFMSYTNFSSVLTPSLFNSTNNTLNTMMSIVISATLLRTNNPNLTTPINFTLKHLTEIDPNGTLSCVYWKVTEWVVDGCELLQSNSSHSVCSCVHLSTFALIMQTNPSSDDARSIKDSDPVMEQFTLVAVAVGLVFLSLALLTFAICRRNPRVTNTAQTNLCISLFLAHLLFLLTQRFLHYIKPQHLVCAVLAGVLHFFFLSAFVWMFIEAVLIFISVKNLTKISSNEKAGLWGKWLVLIGYAVPLVIVSMSAGLVRDGYGSKKCWIKKDFLWSFLGPVSFILAANTILFIAIMIILTSTLTNMKSKILRIQQSERDQRLFKIVTLKAMIQFIILGCSWILGFFSDRSKMLEIVFILLNSQQGTFIFLVHCVLNQEVRQLYMKWWRTVSATEAPHQLDTTTSEF